MPSPTGSPSPAGPKWQLSSTDTSTPITDPSDYIPIQRMRHNGLELVRGVSGAAGWMARGAAMNADELFTFTLDHLPEPARSQEREGRTADTAPATG